jgi:hypothetical protein
VRNCCSLAIRRLSAGHPQAVAIPARDVTACTEETLRQIELSENVQRLDLEPYERSVERLAAVRQEAAAAKAEAEFRAQPARNSKRGRPEGRPAQAGSRRDVAARTGISDPEQRRIERHVALGERYPFLQRSENGWMKATVLRAAREQQVCVYRGAVGRRGAPRRTSSARTSARRCAAALWSAAPAPAPT